MIELECAAQALEDRTALDQQARDRDADRTVGWPHLFEIDPRVGEDARTDPGFLRTSGSETCVVGEVVEVELWRVDGRIDFRSAVALEDGRLGADRRAADRRAPPRRYDRVA